MQDKPAMGTDVRMELIASGWGMRHVLRLILHSKTYQLSAIPRSRDPRAAAHFAAYPLRRLEAEVLSDALCQVTDVRERYVSPVPEPFTYVPEDMRTISLSDGNSTSAFLELFGRPARDTGLASDPSVVLGEPDFLEQAVEHGNENGRDDGHHHAGEDRDRHGPHDVRPAAGGREDRQEGNHGRGGRHQACPHPTIGALHRGIPYLAFGCDLCPGKTVVEIG